MFGRATITLTHILVLNKGPLNGLHYYYAASQYYARRCGLLLQIE